MKWLEEPVTLLCFTSKVCRFKRNSPHRFVYLPQFRKSELEITEGGRDGAVFKFRASTLNGVGNDELVIECQVIITSFDLPYRHE